MVSLPFRFLTPSLLQAIQRINEGQRVKKPFEGRAGMVPLQEGEGSEA